MESLEIKTAITDIPFEVYLDLSNDNDFSKLSVFDTVERKHFFIKERLSKGSFLCIYRNPPEFWIKYKVCYTDNLVVSTSICLYSAVKSKIKHVQEQKLPFGLEKKDEIDVLINSEDD